MLKDLEISKIIYIFALLNNLMSNIMLEFIIGLVGGWFAYKYKDKVGL